MRRALSAPLLSLLLLGLLASADALPRWKRNKGKGGSGSGNGKPASSSAPSPPIGHDYETASCPKCMTTVMRLLAASTNRGCPGANATIVTGSTAGRVPSAYVPTAYCEPLLPKKRACVAYSFGLDGTWDFDRAMVEKGCRVLSFDPLCCGAAHRMGPSHDFIPVGLHTYDGLADSDDPARPNTTFPVLSLRTIMTSYDHPKVDVLRLKISSAHEWKVLKNLVNTGVLQEIRQVSIHMRMEDRTMWEEYKYILNGVRGAGFHPFYVTKQTGAAYLKVQEGSQSLYSAYEVSYGNVN